MRITDLVLSNKEHAIIDEDPFALENAFHPAMKAYQGDRVYDPKYNHFFSAPELLPPINPIANPRRNYGQKIDMWMLGCMMFNMVTGVPPFFSEQDKEQDSEMFKRIRTS